MMICLRALFLLCVLFTGLSLADAQELFGPVTYEVKERYGRENRYRQTFRAPEGPALIKIQNGTLPAERPDVAELSLNGAKLLGDEQYGYPFLACFVRLAQENAIEVNLRDQKPSGMRRPLLPPKLIVLSVLPDSFRLPEGIYGFSGRDGLQELIGRTGKIKSPASLSLALSVINLQRDGAARAEAMRKLSLRKDPGARDFILSLYGDRWAGPQARAEAASALGLLGDVGLIPVLMNGLLDPDEKIRGGSAQALSLFREDDTHQPLTAMLERLDPLRRTGVIKAMSAAGWKPLGTLMDIAGSEDRYSANAAIEVLGHLQDQRASDFLLKRLEAPGAASVAVIVTALGESQDKRAVEPLLALAKDPVKRKGMEVPLGTALANLGDPRAAGAIREMAFTVRTHAEHFDLREAYRRLTGKDMELPQR